MERLVLLILLLLTPIHPVALSVVIIIACCAMSLIPLLSSLGLYWMMSYPFYAACLFLGMVTSNLKVACFSLIFVFSGSVASTVFTNDSLRTLFYILQPGMIAWFIGVLIHFSILQMREKEKLKIENSKNQQIIKIMHVLHDEIANELTYLSIMLQNSITQNGVVSTDEQTHLKHIVDNILIRLRYSVINPFKDTLNNKMTTLSYDVIKKFLALVDDLNDRFLKFGFTGKILYDNFVFPYLKNCDELLYGCIKEISSNIIKYGEPSLFTLNITYSRQCIEVLSSNICKYHGPRNVASSHVGLGLMRRSVESIGGTLTYSQEGNEWVICVRIPVSTEDDE